MKEKGLLILIFLALYTVKGSAQSTSIPLNKEVYHLIDRLEIRSGKMAPNYHSAIKPYSRKNIAQFTDSIKKLNIPSSRQDVFNIEYLQKDNWEWVDKYESSKDKAFLKFFFKNDSDFFYGTDKNENFQIHVNPVLYLSYGKESAQAAYTFMNTRGIQIRGLIDKKVGFYSFISENQVRFPQYVQEYVTENKVVPKEGFWKSFKKNGYDFFTATGYISFNATKHIALQFGHDRQFIGDGYRSLFLSDFSPPSLFFKIKTQVWKINYTNLFTQLTADAYGNSGGSVGNFLFPKKYLVAHRLGMNLGKNVNIGLFESIIFGREDSLGHSYFELSYLNPIIFYRSVEQQNGSIDNAFIGIDVKWNFFRHFSIYGQYMFDEFKISELKARSGWWANKFSYQLGLKYIDMINIKNLDLQVELNVARPYTYAHSNIYSSYTNFNQPLTHPLGANFKEIIILLRYQPIPKLNLKAKFIHAMYGLDTLNSNWGKDILKGYISHEKDYGNTIGQGVGATLQNITLISTYQIKHNMYVDFTLSSRKQTSQEALFDNKSIIYSIAFRWNINQRSYDF